MNLTNKVTLHNSLLSVILKYVSDTEEKARHFLGHFIGYIFTSITFTFTLIAYVHSTFPTRHEVSQLIDSQKDGNAKIIAEIHRLQDKTERMHDKLDELKRAKR